MNFVGSEDEYVASGSDDGNFFLWEKSTGRLHGIYEGDGSVVNVIESHPRLPVLAVSGIDTTVKVRQSVLSSVDVINMDFSCSPLLEAQVISLASKKQLKSSKLTHDGDGTDNIFRWQV